MFECQAKSGIAALCGYDEFTDLSVPPKRYRRKDYSGGWSTITKSSFAVPPACCDSPTCRWDDYIVYTGYREFGVTDCVAIGNAWEDYFSSSCTRPCGDYRNFGSPAPDSWGTGTGAVFDVINTQTKSTQMPNGECNGVNVCADGPLAPGECRQATGSGAVMELSQEDTEADAIARAQAGIPNWDPADCSTDAAFVTQRLAGQYEFSFRSIQVRATGGTFPNPPLILGHDYEFTIAYFRRIIGSTGPWIPTGIVDQQTIHATHTSETTSWFDVPQEDGFETRAQTCSLQDVTPP
ncbi:hypothetical protein KW797_02975 [Candidatus Parcubacteria bacterium]|nr:hypothetical protein [Candidatus Parcubacteria bacterium]